MLLFRIQQACIDNDVLGKPVAHVSSQMQVTGEASYTDDIPQYKGKYNMKTNNKNLIDQLPSHGRGMLSTYMGSWYVLRLFSQF